MKLLQNIKTVYLIGVIGLILVVGTAVFGYVSYNRAPQSSTPEEIADTVSPVNINTASAEELTLLPSLSDQQAQSIVEYREKNGGFSSVEELLNVNGIGRKTYEKIALYITIR